MRTVWQFLLILLLVTTAVEFAEGAEPVARNPLATAADIRAARSALPQDHFRLLYRDETGAEIIFLAGRDYALFQSRQQKAIHDFRLKRVILLDAQQHQFVNSSAYGSAGFADYELYNRQMLKGIFRAAGGDVLKAAPPSTVDDFWIESDLSHSKNPEALAGAVIKRSGGDITAEYAGQVVVNFRPAEQRLPSDFLSSFYKLLRRSAPMHPGILAEIEKSGRVPQELRYVSWRPMRERTEHTLSLVSIEKLYLDYPLPSDAVPKVDDRLGEPFQRVFVPIVSNVLAGKAANPRSTAVEYEQEISSSLQDGRKLDAALLSLEMSLTLMPDCSRNDDICDFIRRTFLQIQEDQRVESFLNAKTHEEKDKRQAANIMQGIPRDGLRYDYILDLFIANNIADAYLPRMTTANFEDKNRFTADVLSRFAAALRGNPFLSGAYKDAGNFYFRMSYPLEAWFLWDAGRSRFGRKSPDLLDHIDAFELGLERDNPWLF